MIRILINGYFGRMGQIITKLCKEHDDIKVVAGVDIIHKEEPLPDGFTLYHSILDVQTPIDCVIDYSSPLETDTSRWENVLTYCLRTKVPCVICTTGLSSTQLTFIQEAAKEIPVFRSANMSLGINLLQSLVETAARTLLAAGFDAEIIEKHHNQKKDAPSGTALMLADSIAKTQPDPPSYVYDRSKRSESRPKAEIGISAVRGGSIVGEHDVLFAGLDEVITISHSAYSREVFGNGSIQAVKFLCSQSA
ncbi:MAG: 4-hydroxy-tetrahydrodipicolinate reductase, partial [Clostridium sp.]|nr:4-hydroxy-tetrahydrodipicolinate reductase [Clostridium sp.]